MKRLKTHTSVLALSAIALLMMSAPKAAAGEIITLEQGWDEASRVVFYQTPQGSPIIPYDYFLALEQSDNASLFMDKAHLSSLGMLYWGKSSLNPDGLPIGLTVDKDIHGVESYLGMNCAACHLTAMSAFGFKACR